MKRFLDYYYVVLSRGYWLLSYDVPVIMSLTFTMNLLSLTLLFGYRHIEWNYLYLGCAVIGIMTLIAFQIIYSSKRTKKLREKYMDESIESRRRGAAWVWFYEILSIVFLIWAISTIGPPQY